MRKDPRRVEEKLVQLYDASLSKWARAGREHWGLAKVPYIRHGRFIVLIAFLSQHRFIQEEPKPRGDSARRHTI
jgi:hypothetical protein